VSVIGVGIDIVDLAGFAEQLDLPGTRFEQLAFSASERAQITHSDPQRLRRLAVRYAAKEAFIKAWSASRFDQPVSLPTWDLSEVQVVNDSHGRPALRLSGAVALAVQQQFGEFWTAHVSLSHDGPTAAAVVVLDLADSTALNSTTGVKK